MKLSEIKGEHAVEVIADLIEPITNIATDEKCKGVFKTVAKHGETPAQAAIRNIKATIPLLLKTHKTDVATIIALLEDKPVDSLNIVRIIGGIIEAFNDEALLMLFKSAAPAEEAQAPQAEQPKV